ncbi:MAG TPA: hypothetical protein VM432_09285 [Bdellovibrionales bacterium]|nr:hypothetical protein [Bdellovibrionales bacterium]
MSYLVMILVGLVSVAVYFTGEPAEEMIEHLAGVEESYIEAHEDVASYGFILTEVLAVLGGIGIYAFDRRPRLSRFVLRAAIILSLLNMAVMAYVANLGGKIRHTEIRGPSSDVAPSENED